MIKIMVVHDSEFARQKIAEAVSLAIQPSHVFIAPNGEESLRMIGDGFHIVIVDWMVCRNTPIISQLREASAEAVIVYLAPNQAGREFSRALDAGASGFMWNYQSFNPELWRAKFQELFGANHPLFSRAQEEAV